MIEVGYNAPETHDELAWASPEYIIRPLLSVVESFPPINHLLLEPSHNAA